MRNSAILNLNRTKCLNVLSKHRMLIFILLTYITGIILGVFWLKSSNAIYEIAASDFAKFLSVRIGASFFKAFCDAFLALLPICLILFICGTSVVGVVLIPLTVCYCGFDYGISTGYLYREYLLQGIAFNSLILIPCTLVALLGYVLLSKEAFDFSLNLLRVTMPKVQEGSIYSSFRGYCKKFMLLILIFIAAATLESLLTKAFLNFFSFK